MKFILMSLLSSVALSTTPPRKQVPESTRRLSNSTPRRLFLKLFSNILKVKAMQAPTPTIKQPATSTPPPEQQLESCKAELAKSTRRLSNSTRRLFLKALGNYARYKAMQAPTPTIKQPATSTPTTEQQLESCKAELVTHCCDQYEAFLKNNATDRAWINKETTTRKTVLRSDFTKTVTDCKCDFNKDNNRYQCYNKYCPKKTQVKWEGCFASKECSGWYGCVGEKETESGDVRSGYCASRGSGW